MALKDQRRAWEGLSGTEEGRGGLAQAHKRANSGGPCAQNRGRRSVHSLYYRAAAQTIVLMSMKSKTPSRCLVNGGNPPRALGAISLVS